MTKRTTIKPIGIDAIYSKRQPRRPHYLREWVERREFETDAAFADAIWADKSVVSRWLDEHNASTPGPDWQRKLGVFFGDEEDPADIFRHPDDDWIAKFFRDRRPEEIEHIKKSMETTFPPQKRRG
jgi:hypothetical protein